MSSGDAVGIGGGSPMGVARAAGPHSVVHSVMFVPCAIAGARGAWSSAEDMVAIVDSRTLRTEHRLDAWLADALTRVNSRGAGIAAGSRGLTRIKRRRARGAAPMSRF